MRRGKRAAREEEETEEKMYARKKWRANILNRKQIRVVRKEFENLKEILRII